MRETLRNIGYGSLLPWVTALFIGVVYVILSTYIVPLGDDVGFTLMWRGQQGDVWYTWPRFVWRHFNQQNGRMADMLTPVLLNVFPGWLRAMTNGLVTGAFFLLIPLCSGLLKKVRSLGTLFVMALAAFTFRWDAIWMEFCASYNYVWSAAFGLLAVWLIFRRPEEDYGLWTLVAIPFCVVAGAMHEASGFALAAGAGIYWLINRRTGLKSWSIGRRLIFWAFIVGGVFTLCAPGAYRRVGGTLVPESPVSILFGSGIYLVIMVVIAFTGAFLSLKRGGLANLRSLIGRALRGRVTIWVVAALISSVFMFASRYGGRPGWFVQVFALIACTRMVASSEFRKLFGSIRLGGGLSAALSWIIVLCIVAHFVALCVAQKRLSEETREVIALYRESSDGIIYYAPTPDHSMSWYLLGKTHGVPDADDSYYLDRVSGFYRGEDPDSTEKHLVVLPTEWRSVDLNSFSGTLRLTDRYGDDHILTDRRLPTCSYPLFEIYPRRVAEGSGSTLLTETRLPGARSLYYYTTLHEDRGEK